MTGLGNLGGRLRLACNGGGGCRWLPPDDMTMGAFKLHFQVEHDTDKVATELVPVCSCGAVMTITETRPTGGGSKDYAACGACGNTGYLYRRDTR